jgi:hypothetical protein
VCLLVNAALAFLKTFPISSTDACTICSRNTVRFSAPDTTVDSILIFDAVGEEGLFRVSGNHEDLNNLKVDIDEGMFT